MINFFHPRSLDATVTPNHSGSSGEYWADGWILSGSTGLLGRFLLRELLRRGDDVCVLVRKRGGVTAAQRIESIVQFWEDELKQHLARPLVIEANLLTPGLGLSDQDRTLLSGRYPKLLHCAASVRFDFDQQKSEPLSSNIDGTANLLAFAELIGVQHIHHVSTAYVCGNAAGEVFEVPCNPHAAFRNPYEYSKAAAERLVANSRFKSKTIYRPSIVVGRHFDGFANAFHTLYSLLRFSREVGLPMVDQLANYIGIDGSELSNVVPVDWVAESIANISANPDHWGKIFHLTNETEATSGNIIQAIKNAVENCQQQWDQLPTTAALQNAAVEAFNIHLSVYSNYFHNDPAFVNYNARCVPGYVPAPIVDVDSLQRAFAFAIRHSFKDTTGFASTETCSVLSPFIEYLRQSQQNFVCSLGESNAPTARLSSNVSFTKVTITGKHGGVFYVAVPSSRHVSEISVPAWALDLLLTGRTSIRSILDAEIVLASDTDSEFAGSFLEDLLTQYQHRPAHRQQARSMKLAQTSLPSSKNSIEN